MTRPELARQIGLSRVSIWRMEQGQQSINLDCIRRIASLSSNEDAKRELFRNLVEAGQ